MTFLHRFCFTLPFSVIIITSVCPPVDANETETNTHRLSQLISSGAHNWMIEDNSLFADNDLTYKNNHVTFWRWSSVRHYRHKSCIHNKNSHWNISNVKAKINMNYNIICFFFMFGFRRWFVFFIADKHVLWVFRAILLYLTLNKF